jgi:hypothetical protein
MPRPVQEDLRKFWSNYSKKIAQGCTNYLSKKSIERRDRLIPIFKNKK